MSQNQYSQNSSAFVPNQNQFNQPQFNPSPVSNPPYAAHGSTLKHSKMGIASLVLAVLSVGLSVLTFAAIKLLQMRGLLVDWGIVAILLLVVIGGFTGTILGFATLFTQNTKKVFGIIGLALNLFFLGCLILDLLYENLNKF